MFWIPWETLNEYCVWISFFLNGWSCLGSLGSKLWDRDQHVGNLPGMPLEGSRIQQREKSSCDGASGEASNSDPSGSSKMNNPSEPSSVETRELGIYTSVSIRNVTWPWGIDSSFSWGNSWSSDRWHLSSVPLPAAEGSSPLFLKNGLGVVSQYPPKIHTQIALFKKVFFF